MSNFKKSEIDLRKSHTEIETECGYCGGSGLVQAAYTYTKLTPQDYEYLVNQGWCRYGDYYYKPNVKKSCCKIFAHRLDITQFTLRPSQKKVIKKWEKFLINDKKIIHQIPKQDKIQDDSVLINILEEGRQEEGSPNPKNPEITKIDKNMEILQNGLEKLMEAFQNQQISLKATSQAKKVGKLEISEEARRKIKLLKANSKKYGEYSTNILMLIYAENKTKLRSSVGIRDIQTFVTTVRDQIQNFLAPQVKPFHIYIQGNGYISFGLDQNKTIKSPIVKRNISIKPPQSKLGSFCDSCSRFFNVFRKKPSPNPLPLFDPKIEENNQKVRTILVPAHFDPEAFEVYKKHCDGRHEGKNKTEEIFRQFFCLKAFDYVTLSGKNRAVLPIGSFHIKYYLEKKLIAVGVLDITPTCMQSIYFFYDPEYSYLSLGVIGVLKEIEYMKKMQVAFPKFKYYHLGGYIQTCQKVKYKVDYEPAELLCPETYTWVRFHEELQKKISQGAVRLAKKNVKGPKDQDFSKTNIDKFILKNIKINSGTILGQAFEPKLEETVLEFFREAAEYSGKKLLSNTNFILKTSS